MIGKMRQVSTERTRGAQEEAPIFSRPSVAGHGGSDAMLLILNMSLHSRALAVQTHMWRSKVPNLMLSLAWA